MRVPPWFMARACVLAAALLALLPPGIDAAAADASVVPAAPPSTASPRGPDPVPARARRPRARDPPGAGPGPRGAVVLQLPPSAQGDEVSLRAGDALRVSCIGQYSKVAWAAEGAEPPTPPGIAVAVANHMAVEAMTGGGERRDLAVPAVSGLHAGPYCCAPVSDRNASQCFYLYVKDPEQPFVLRKTEATLNVVQGRNATVDCRPTSKDLVLELNMFYGSNTDSWTFDPRKGFTKIMTKNDDGIWNCVVNGANNEAVHVIKVHESTESIIAPTLEFPYLVREGANVAFTCTIKVESTVIAKLSFKFPNPAMQARVSMQRPQNEYLGSMTVSTLYATLSNASVADSGDVLCAVEDHGGSRNATHALLEVLPARALGTPPRLRLGLLPPAPRRLNSRPAFVSVQRVINAKIWWYVVVAWEGGEVPSVQLADPEGAESSVDASGKGASKASVEWETDPRAGRDPGPGVGREATVIVKLPKKPEPGNYSLHAWVSAGSGRRRVEAVPLRLEVAIEGTPLTRLHPVSSVAVGAALQMAPGEEARLVCAAVALPQPYQIKWLWAPCAVGDDVCLRNKQAPAPGKEVNLTRPGRGRLESTWLLRAPPGEGAVTCVASNFKGQEHASWLAVAPAAAPAARGASVSLVGGVVGVVMLIIGAAAAGIYFTLRQKRARRRLHCAGTLQGLVAGAPDALDPSLPADEQAELLPYDPRWEFPRDSLTIGKQLGAGAFGVVAKGEAVGIVEDEDITTVAVKMVKRGADEAFLRALASELKILVHLGRHLNVVNLLGACTGRIADRELLVIVEYCPYGNLHNYLLRHRDGFVDQVDPRSGAVDLACGAAQLAAAEAAVRRARLLLNTGDSSGSFCVPTNAGSDSGALTAVTYFPGGAGAATSDGYDSGGASVPLSPLLLSSEDTSGSGPQPLWRTNYRGDARAPGRVLCTADLLSWCYQVACGMQYLARRKVLHGDLAARNVLLARDGVVKICDFGLARSMFKSDTYKKKGDGPLPIKWMALESIRDRIFSTQSDVWSFGVVMWELFSLGATPYPGLQPSEEFYNKLVTGYRMERPQYAPIAIYELMLKCWEVNPCRRPDFVALSSDLAELMDVNTRERFERLNAYEQQRGGAGAECDYLAMLGSPDYRALTSPEEHVYVNSTPPTPTVSSKVHEVPSTDPDPKPNSDYLNMSSPNTPGSNQISFF